MKKKNDLVPFCRAEGSQSVPGRAVAAGVWLRSLFQDPGTPQVPSQGGVAVDSALTPTWNLPLVGGSCLVQVIVTAPHAGLVSRRGGRSPSALLHFGKSSKGHPAPVLPRALIRPPLQDPSAASPVAPVHLAPSLPYFCGSWERSKKLPAGESVL